MDVRGRWRVLVRGKKNCDFFELVLLGVRGGM